MDQRTPIRAVRIPDFVWIIGILFFCYVFSMLDRQVLAVISTPLKGDLKIGDFQLSLLLGPAFAASYILFGPVFGFLADKWSRPKTIFLGLFIWMIGTAACGFAGSFAALFAFRLLVGAGEAALSPAAYAIIAGTIPKHQLGTALVVYSWGAMSGTALSLILGGIALDMFSAMPEIVVPLVGSMSPWQLVFLLVALPGLILCPLSLLLPDRDKTPENQGQKFTLAQAGTKISLLEFIRSKPSLLAAIFLAYGLTTLISYTVIVWTPQFVERTYEYTPGEIGKTFGPIALVAPLLASLAMGLTVDRWFRAGRRNAHFVLYLICLIIASPSILLTYLTSVPLVFWAGIAAIMGLMSAAVPAGSAALQIITPSHLRGQVSGAFISFVNITGAMIGPVLAGFLVEYGFRDDGQLGFSLFIIVACSVAAIIPLLLYASRRMSFENIDPHN